MTQRILTPILLTLLLLVAVPQPSWAQEGKQTPSVTREEMTKASDAANKITEPGAQASPEATPAESDEIGAFHADEVRGMAHPWQMYYQKAASPVMEELEWLHNYVFIIITIITIVVTVLLAYVCIRFREKKNPKPHRFAHNTLVEIIWTALPIIILIAIGIPSVRAHYQYTDNENIINNPDLTLKVTGNQWYWSYEYPDFGIKYDSNIVKDADLKQGEPRLLMVDNPVVVPVNKVVRVQMTSADVIHSWAMPAFGVKQDVIPGRLNETWFKADKEGIYFGQCSELCGKYHGFMPIMVKVVSDEDFKKWVEGAKQKFASDDHQQLALNQ
jgi:cytochrome c oxidase subunit 2